MRDNERMRSATDWRIDVQVTVIRNTTGTAKCIRKKQERIQRVVDSLQLSFIEQTAVRLREIEEADE